MKCLILKLLCAIIFASVSCAALAADEMDDAQIIADTIQGTSNCIHYQLVGICFWQKNWYSPPRATLKLDQYMPDAVVSVFTKPDNNPWWFASHLVDSAAYQTGQAEIKNMTHFNMGYGDSHDNSGLDVNNRFHEVDIIGNPALLVFKHIGGAVMLPSTARPYFPYYLSLLDAYTWRFPGVERLYPGALIPGLHDVGTIIIHDWGPVFPRNGYVNQPDDAKAGAVNAQRAADIITQDGQPHLYKELSNSCGVHCKAAPVAENSKQVEFQMIYPKVETSCMIFGKSDAGSAQPWGMDAAQAGNNRYVWVMWRHYHGCIQGHGKFIGSIDW